jgi:hypothetical protein
MKSFNKKNKKGEIKKNFVSRNIKAGEIENQLTFSYTDTNPAETPTRKNHHSPVGK